MLANYQFAIASCGCAQTCATETVILENSNKCFRDHMGISCRIL